MAHENTGAKCVDFGHCQLCKRWLTEEEYQLGLGRCRDCARKCDDEVSFDTQYGNVAVQQESSRAPSPMEGRGPGSSSANASVQKRAPGYAPLGGT